MQRRSFFAASCAAGLTMTGLGQMASADDSSDQALIELRTYSTANKQKRDQLVEILDKAGVPAWNRIGVGPVGVLTFDPADNTQGANKLDIEARSLDVTVVLPHKSMESVVTANRKLMADPQYREAAAALFADPKDPVYERIESSLSLAFEKCPRVEAPTDSKDRILQLRIYESANADRAIEKVHMFNSAELDVFRKCNMDPVFFGETLVGRLVPNLTYMLGFADTAAKEEAWKEFIAHPDWKAIKDLPRYKNTVSNITNLMLRPSPGSQI